MVPNGLIRVKKEVKESNPNESTSFIKSQSLVDKYTYKNEDFQNDIGQMESIFLVG